MSSKPMTNICVEPTSTMDNGQWPQFTAAVIGCGSCVSTHATGGNYLEIIGAILDVLGMSPRMNIISVTKTGGHEKVPHR